ncbi:hypothetical protein Tco_1014752 [Tanacetum coccineum]
MGVTGFVYWQGTRGRVTAALAGSDDPCARYLLVMAINIGLRVLLLDSCVQDTLWLHLRFSLYTYDGISSSLGRTNFAKSDSKCSELPESIGIIEESYLSQSDEVAKLLDMVEVAFVKHFCNGSRHQAMLSTLFSRVTSAKLEH